MKTVARLLGGGFDSDVKMMEIYDFEEGIGQVDFNKSTVHKSAQFLF